MVDGKPHATVTEVKYFGGRVISKSSGWIYAPPDVVLHVSEADATVSLISDIDVLMARLANMRDALQKKLLAAPGDDGYTA